MSRLIWIAIFIAGVTISALAYAQEDGNGKVSAGSPASNSSVAESVQDEPSSQSAGGSSAIGAKKNDRAESVVSRKYSSPIEEIIVTAEKRAENIQDVPISVQAFSGAALEARGIKNQADLQKITPGLEVDQQVAFTTVYLRGVGSDAFLSADPSVATYIDGIYFPFSQGLVQDFGAIKRVEVLKGPQGTLFGRNAVGGAINIVTEDPSFTDAKGSFRSGYNNFDTFSPRIFLNIPLSNNLAVSISGLYSTGHNYYTGTVNGRSLPDENAQGARVKVRWDPLEGLDIVLAGLRLQQHGLGSIFQLNADPSLLGRVLGITPQTGYSGAVNEPSFLNLSNRVEYGIISYTAPWAPWVDFKLLGSNQKIATNYTYDFDGSPQPLVAFDEKKNGASVQTVEAQIISNDATPGASWLKWIGGVYYFHSAQGFDTANLRVADLDFAALDGNGVQLPPVLVQPLENILDPLKLGFPNGDIALHALLGTLSLAGYAQATATLTDWFSLTLGARYQHEKRFIIRSDSGLYSTGGNFIPLFVWTEARDASGNPVPTHNITDSFKPKVSLNFHPFEDDTLVYLSYQQAEKSSAYNTVAVYESPEFVKPEDLTAYEIGVKTSLLDGQVRLGAAAFHYHTNNVQVQFISLIQGGAVSFENAQAARIVGTDFNLSANLFPELFDNLRLMLGGAYLDGKYLKYTNAAGFDPTFGVFSHNNDYSGNTTVRTPKFTGTADLTKSWDLWRGELELGGDAYFNSGFYYAASDASNVRQSSYYLMGAHLSYLYRPYRLRVTLFGQNLNDEKYSSGILSTDFGNDITLAPPRTYGVRFNLDF